MRKYLVLALIASLLVAMPFAAAGKGSIEKRAWFNVLEKTVDETALAELKSKIPESYEATEAQIAEPKTKFLMWNSDGEHIMWGTAGSGLFVGTDTTGNKAWGIYEKHVFGGLYNGTFFWGRFTRNKWTAFGLFGLEKSTGNLVSFQKSSEKRAPGNGVIPLD